MTDKMGHGGVHGAKDCYNHVDLRSTNKYSIPVSAKDNIQTLKAFDQILGNYPRGNYYSDNALCLAFAARSIGLKHELSLPGVSQTNGIAEVNNRVIIASTRKLLAQAGLPACWWPYASPCYCFQHNALLDLDNQSGYYDDTEAASQEKCFLSVALFITWYLQPGTTEAKLSQHCGRAYLWDTELPQGAYGKETTW